MKSTGTRLPKIEFALSLAIVAASLPALGQDEKYYRHPDGHQLEVWPGGDGGASLQLEVGDRFFSAELSADQVGAGASAGAPVTWTWYGDGEEELTAGSGTVRISEQSVVLGIAAKAGQHFESIDPSGVYRRLTDDDRVKIAYAEYKEVDGALNRTYSVVREQLKDRPELWSDLRQRQREWIEYRDHIAEHPASVGYDGDKEKSPGYWQTMAGLTESRTEFLKIFSGDSVPAGREGVYRDEHSGMLTIRNADDEGFDFDFSVVRGPTFHLGQIEARARYDKSKPGEAVFVDTDREAFIDGKPCTIRFKFDGKRVEVGGENTMYYHGMRAYFDGEFFKHGDLDKAANPVAVE